MSNTTTPATSDDALRAENEALKAQLAEIDKALGEWRGNTTLEKAQAMQRHAQLQAQAYGRFIIGMQACIIDAELSNKYSETPAYMDWLIGSLEGPGLLPDLEEAKSLGGAQAFADKAYADLDAHYAKYPIPENKELEALRAELARWADPHQHWLVQRHDGGVYLCLGTGICSDMAAPPEGWALEAPVLQLLTQMHNIIQSMSTQEDLVQSIKDKVDLLASKRSQAAAPAATEDAPLETGEADARELPPEVAAKFMTPQ